MTLKFPTQPEDPKFILLAADLMNEIGNPLSEWMNMVSRHATSEDILKAFLMATSTSAHGVISMVAKKDPEAMKQVILSFCDKLQSTLLASKAEIYVPSPTGESSENSH